MRRFCFVLVLLLAHGVAVAEESNIQIYGILDEGLADIQGGAGGHVLKLSSGIQSQSRIGFKGKENLGGDLYALFVLESGFTADDGALVQNRLWGRTSYVGLGNRFGTITAGRIYTPLYTAVDSLDPVLGIGGGNDNIFPRGGVRLDNTIQYASPIVRGFSGMAAYTLGEVPNSIQASRVLGGSLSYEAGPLTVRLAFSKTNDATAVLSAKNTFLGGSYNFGPLTGFLAFQTNRGTPTTNNNDALLGVSVPFGRSLVGVSVIKVTDHAAAHSDATQMAAAYVYTLSKRTNFYASYTHINNKNALVYVTAEGIGDREINVGIRHRF